MLEGAKRVVRFEQEMTAALDTIGEMPLPPIFMKNFNTPDRYQTVFANETGSAAAPTAACISQKICSKKCKPWVYVLPMSPYTLA